MRKNKSRDVDVGTALPRLLETRAAARLSTLTVAKREDKKIRPPVSALIQKLYDTFVLLRQKPASCVPQ